MYSKLFEEAEKIKAWKLKRDYDISQKERKLQESRRTIETQRKAIQELQVYMAMIRQAAQIQLSGICSLIGKEFLQSKLQKNVENLTSDWIQSTFLYIVSSLIKLGIQDT